MAVLFPVEEATASPWDTDPFLVPLSPCTQARAGATLNAPDVSPPAETVSAFVDGEAVLKANANSIANAAATMIVHATARIVRRGAPMRVERWGSWPNFPVVGTWALLPPNLCNAPASAFKAV